ncbi:MAG: tetratricopeptide repeat protein [Candidatus Yanofskybacteria bacterium]|nr:tetratricopeptide repeat protein [Candidatus Yanofskybacteria bacterium]
MPISSFLRRFWPILVLVVVGFFVYFFNLNNQLFWDDDDWIINNVFVHKISWNNIQFWLTHNTLAGVGLPSNYYRPFLFLTFAINYIIAGVKPLIWHLTNNLLHIANAILIFLLLAKFVSRRIAFLTAFIFTVHPLQTEAITYIAGRGDPLNVFFMLLGLWFYVMGHGRRLLTYKILPLVCLVLALLSRETAIIFPFVLMVFYISFLANSRFLTSLKKALLTAAPYFGIVIVYGILRLTVLNFQNTLNFYSVANTYSESLIVRLLTFGGVLVDYLRLLFVPVGLHMERGSIVYTSLLQWPIFLVFTVLVILAIFLIYLYRKEMRRGSQVMHSASDIQNSNFRIWFFGVGWFFVGLAPVSGITPVNAVMYEHWLYLPMVGFFFIASVYFDRLLSFVRSRRLVVVYCLLIVALAAYFFFFIAQSIRRNILWGKPLEFYQDILKYEPKSTRINNNLGNLYFGQGDLEKAKQYYEKAAEGDDSFAQPHFNLGSILESQGDIFGAIQKYKKAIEIDPDFYYAHQNLMAIYANKGDLVKAIEYVEILKKIRSQDPRVFYNAALLYVARGDEASALRDLRAGLEVSGSDPYAEQLIKDLLAKLGG